MEKKRCNIRDLAKAAGLSAGTVSRILNNRPGKMKIPEQTRSRVVELARELQYVPNIHARRLFTRRSGVIGFVIPSSRRSGETAFGNSHLSHVFAGMETRLDEGARSIELVVSNTQFVETHSCLARFRDGSIDGLLIWGAYEDELFWQELVDSRYPYVFVGGYPQLESWVNCVTNDDAYAAGVITEHILKAGHRRVLFLENAPGRSPAWHRSFGVNAALANQGLPPECVQVTNAPAEQVLQELRAGGSDATAIVTADYRQAELFRGMEISVGCCSTYPGEAVAWPGLARVENDDAQIGQEAIRAIENIIDAGDPFLVNLAIKGRFIEGETIVKIKKGKS